MKNSMKWAPVWISLIILSFSVGAAVPRVLNTTTFSTLFTGEAGSGADAFNVSTNGARHHFGTGANDYASSDGTTVTFAGPTSSTALALNGVVFTSATAPTISSGFGTSPSILFSNGSDVFSVNVGTGGTANSGIVGLPTAPHGWICNCQNFTAGNLRVIGTVGLTTSCTLNSFSRTTGVAQAWAASEQVDCVAFPY